MIELARIASNEITSQRLTQKRFTDALFDRS